MSAPGLQRLRAVLRALLVAVAAFNGALCLWFGWSWLRGGEDGRLLWSSATAFLTLALLLVITRRSRPPSRG